MISNSIDSVPSSPYASILNFRDVGETINLVLGKSYLKERILFRSAHLDDINANDHIGLVRRNHIHTILDLRSQTEHIESTKRFPSRSEIPQSSRPIQHEAISLSNAALERALIWRLSWWNLIKLLTLLLIGARLDAIALLGQHVLRPRGLCGLAIDTLTYSTQPLLTLLQRLAQASTFPALVHCTQGKDRTGLLVILVLLLCHVPIPAIAADYRASERELAPERATREQELLRLGMGAEFARCEAGFVEAVVAWLDARGGIEGWLEGIGGVGVAEGVRTALLA